MAGLYGATPAQYQQMTSRSDGLYGMSPEQYDAMTDTHGLTMDAAQAEAGGVLPNSFAYGLRQIANSGEAYAANAAEALGADKLARGLYAGAKQGVMEAQPYAPPPMSSVHDLDSAINYGAGQVGSAAGGTAPALALTALTRRPWLGGASMVPQFGGDLAMSLHEDPNTSKLSPTERFGLATGGGVGMAALGEAPLSRMTQRLFSREAAPGLRKAMGEVGVNSGLMGATTAGQDAIGQGVTMYADPTKQYNPEQTEEAALGGMIGGAALSAPHVALAHGLDLAQSSANKGAGLAKQGVDKGVDLTKQGAASAQDMGEELFPQFHPDFRILATKQRIPDGPDFDAKFTADNDARNTAAGNVATRILNDPNATPAELSAAKDFQASAPNNPLAWKTIADVVQDKGVASRAKRGVSWMSDAVQSFYAGLTGQDKKASFQRTHEDQAVFEHMHDALAERAADPTDADNIYEYAKLYLQGDDVPLRPMVDVFGTDTTSVLARMHGLMARAGLIERSADAESTISQQVQAELAQRRSDRAIVRDSLALEHGSPSAAELDMLSSQVRQGLSTPLEGERLQQFNALMQRAFGKNAPAVADALAPRALRDTLRAKDYDPTAEHKSATDEAGSAEDFGSDAVATDYEAPLTETQAPDTSYIGSRNGTDSHFWQLDHPEHGADIRARYAKAKAALESRPNTRVTELTPTQYMRDTGLSAREVAAKLGHVPAEHDTAEKAVANSNARMLRVERSPLDHEPLALTQAEVAGLFKAHAEAQRRVKRDLSTMDDGRFFVRDARPEIDKGTGETKFPQRAVSAHDLVSLMMKKSGESDPRKAFAAGVSSLLNSEHVRTEKDKANLWYRDEDGEAHVAHMANDLPPHFPVMNHGDGRKTYLIASAERMEMLRRQARGELEQYKKDGAKLPMTLPETERATFKDLPNLTDGELRDTYRHAEDEGFKEAIVEEAARRKSVVEEVRTPGDGQKEDYKPVYPKGELGTSSYVKNERRESADTTGKDEYRAIDTKAETEEFSQGAEKKWENETRHYQEETGTALHPHERLSADRRLDVLRERGLSVARELDAVSKRLAEIAPENAANAVLRGRLQNERNGLLAAKAKAEKKLDALRSEYAGLRDTLRSAEAASKTAAPEDVEPSTKGADAAEQRRDALSREAERVKTLNRAAPEVARVEGVKAENVEKANGLYARIEALNPHAILNGEVAKHVTNAALRIENAISSGDFSDAERSLRKAEALAKKTPDALSRPDLSSRRSEREMTEEQRKEIEGYVLKTRGKDVQVLISKTLGRQASGMWTKTGSGRRVIEIAATALDPLSTAHHEALHDFFDMLRTHGGDDIAKTLQDAASSAYVRKQLELHFADEPRVLAQMKADPEEAVANMYQLWAAGKLRVGPRTEGLFKRVATFIRKLFGMLTNDEKAEQIMQAFHSGELRDMSGVGKTLAEFAKSDARIARVAKTTAPVARIVQEGFFTSSGHLIGNPNEHLDWIGRQFFNRTGEKDKEQGLLYARKQMVNHFTNRMSHAIKDNVPADADDDLKRQYVDAALDALQKEQRAPNPVAEKIRSSMRAALDEAYDYAKKSGMDLGFQKNYFPRVWDAEHIAANSEKFEKMLLDHHGDILQDMADKYNKKIADALAKEAGEGGMSGKAAFFEGTSRTAQDVARSITNKLIGANGVDHFIREDASELGFTPFMAAGNERKLDFLDRKVFSEFEQKDLVKTVSAYMSQLVHRAEYVRRFGDTGDALHKRMLDAYHLEVERGKTSEEAMTSLKNAQRAVMAMEGTLGHDISPMFRRLSAWTIAYENYRTLPLALFSNLVDPLGVMVRGGTMRDAVDTFRRGMQEVLSNWRGKTVDDEAARFAETVGTVDAGGFLSAMGSMNSSVYMYGGAKKLNDALFHMNGVEALNRGVRIAATQAAIGFIKRHALSPNEHSKRYLEELFGEGFDPKSLNIKDGVLDTTDARVQKAIVRWVDEAVLHPNAAIRPNWGSDPHWALVFHLKSFTYAFQQQILKRVALEMQHGNYDPLLTMALGYVPIMIGADIVKGLVQNLGETPDWKKGWDAGDYLWNGVQRSGLTGIGQFGLDAYEHGPGSLLGPAGEQVYDAFKDPFGKTVTSAIPNPIGKNIAASYMD